MDKIEKKGGNLIVPDHVKIPYITGDGIGKEITPVCLAVVDAAVNSAYGSGRSILWQEVPAGQDCFEKRGTYLPDETLCAFKEYLVGLKGPLMTPVGGGIRSLNVALRQTLDLYVCLRPVRYFSGVASPVRHPERVDICVFRENTEDIYAGIEWESGSPQARKFGNFLRNEMGVSKVRFPDSSAYGVKPVSREGSERLIRSAIQYAISHNRPSVTLVHKGNIMKFTEGGFRAWGYELAQREFGQYIDSGALRIDDCICDAFLQNALLTPEKYSVVATLNLNGDYISDMLAAQVGGIGISPGANINYESGHAIFEATHGVAPAIAGKDIANPSSIILSAAMMLDYMGWSEASSIITDTLAQAFRQGIATPDIASSHENGHAVGTKEFGRKLISLMDSK